jgi:N-acetyl-alpha-D-muramate 1-phosphate uridylyltransferase
MAALTGLRAMLLAAGRGERLRPLTDACPKPLLQAAGRALIEWQIAALVRAGIVDIVINVAHLGARIEAALGDGSRHGARIRYRDEGAQAGAALETRGGIVNALDLLGSRPFVVASSDIVTDFDYATLAAALPALEDGRCDAHLVLVDNPPHHPRGDLGCVAGRAVRSAPLLNYGGIALFAPRLFAGLAADRAALFPWLHAFVDAGRVSAQHYRGAWHNVGTAEQLATLDRALRARGAASGTHV